MSSSPRRLSPDRAAGVEARLRARSEQLKPTELSTAPGTPLGICRACSTLVYAGDGAAVVGRSLILRKCVGRAD